MIDLLFQAAIGLLAGLFGGLLGVGGSVIIIPALILYLSHAGGGYRGSSQHLIQAAAMICNVFIAAPAVVAHCRAGAIMRSVVIFLIPSAVLGIELGVAASNSSVFARENGAYLGMILAGFLVYVAGYNTVRLFGRAGSQPSFEQPRKPAPWAVVAVGIPIGLVAGLLGIGGGALCVPMQQILLRLPLRRAIANSATTIVCSAVIGATHKNLTLPSHGFNVAASLRLAGMLIPTAILGSYFGGRLTHILPRKALRTALIVFMATVAWLTFSHAWNTATTAAEPPESSRHIPSGGLASHDRVIILAGVGSGRFIDKLEELR